MKLTMRLLCILACFSLNQKLMSDPIITFFMRHYPDAEQMASKLKKAGKASKYALHGLSDYAPFAGIFSTYSGFIQVSDVNGQTSFPRKHQSPKLTLIITPKITPVTMLDTMIDHWEIESISQTALYNIERKQDPETKIFFWDIQKKSPPADKKLPLTTLAIIAKEKYIYVPEGITITKDTPNLTLPDLYVRKGIHIASNALYLLNLRHFFGQLRNKYQKEPKRYRLHISE